MLERQYCCSRLEVRVVARHSEVISGGKSRGQQVRDSCGPVLAPPSEFSLRAQSGLPMFSIHRSRCASGEPLAAMINYLPLDIAPDAGELETNGLHLSLRTRGVHVRLARQRIGAAAGDEGRGAAAGREAWCATVDDEPHSVRRLGQRG
jgi:UTRA domain-containing protein